MERRKIRATSARSSKLGAGKPNTKKRIVEKWWKEAESEQLEQEVAKTGIEKSTKKVQKRRPKALAGRHFDGSRQVSSGTEQVEQKEGRMEHLWREVARLEQPENDGKQTEVCEFRMGNGGSIRPLECLMCTLSYMFEVVSMSLFGFKAVLEHL